MTLKHSYDGLLDLITERTEDVERFLHFLETQTNWLTAPASISYHMNVEGGLIKHSLLTTRTLLRIRDTLQPGFNDETCAIVGLFHDVGKVGAPGQPFYVPTKDDEGKLTWRVNKDLVAMGQGVRSLYLCAGVLPLTDEEAQAICYHDGQYVAENLAIKNKERPLTLLLHFADMWSSHVVEVSEESNSSQTKEWNP
jgi:hypothetical protein